MGTVHAKSVTDEPDMNNHSFKRNPSPMKKNQKTENTKVMIDLEGVKARVDKVHVDGLARTKDDIIKTQVTELFKAKNLEEVISYVQKVQSRLDALGCFKSTWVYIDTSHGPDATPEGVEVTFNVRELSRLAGEISTMVGNNDGSLVIGVRAPNLFGRGEKVRTVYSRGLQNTTNFNVSATKPFIGPAMDRVLTGSIFSTSYDFPWSGFKQFDKGFLVDISGGTNSSLTHSWQYEGVFRNIVPSKQTSFLVREQCGPNLKSAFRHICTLDKRDSPIFPTAGSLVKFSTEIAGLGGDIGFVKNELIMQANWSPHEFCTFQLGLQAGLLRSISNSMKINIADKFFLGGPMNVRGFDMRGCGPRHDGHSLGGDGYWAAALHMYTSLPFVSSRNSFSQNFKLHGFINGGNVCNFKPSFGMDWFKFSTEDVRCTVGAGLAMKLGNVARVEFNFIHPLLFHRSDVLKQFQFGIGVQYL